MPPFCYALPAVCFWRSALTEHGAKTIAYNQSKNESKRNKQTRQKAKEKGKPIILYSTHIQKQEKRKAILFPSMPIYRIAIYYNKAI